VGGHGSLGSVSSSLMGVTLGYPSGHPDPHSSMSMSLVEGQNTADSTVIATSATAAESSDTTGLIARQPPTGIDTETAAATNPTQVTLMIIFITIRYDTIRDAILTCARKPT